MSSRGTPETEQVVDAVILEALVHDAALADAAGMNGLQGSDPAGKSTDEGDLYPPDEALVFEPEITEGDSDEPIDSLLQDLLEDI